mgnify:FL=1
MCSNYDLKAIYYDYQTQGFGFENKSTEALSFRQIYECLLILATSQHIEGCLRRWWCEKGGFKVNVVVFFRRGCFLVIVICSLKGGYGCIWFDDHDYESNLFWFSFGLKTKPWVWKGCFFKHHVCAKRVKCRRGEVDYRYLAVHGVRMGIMRRLCKNS